MFRLSTLTLLSASLCWGCQPAAAQFPTTDLPPLPTQAKPRTSTSVSKTLPSAEPSRKQEERQPRSLPLSPTNSLQLARDFIRALEEQREPPPSYIAPSARLFSQEIRVERLLLDALQLQRRPSSRAPASVPIFYQLDLRPDPPALASSSESPTQPNGMTIHVSPLPGAHTSSAQAWLLRLRDSSQGLQITEVHTPDGQLPVLPTNSSP